MKTFFKGFSFAVSGIRQAVASQRNMRIHFGVAFVVAAAGFYFEISITEWGLVLLAIGLVISAELMNTAIETLVDLIEPGKNPKAGRIKDIAAGSVLIAAICALGIGLLVFLKYLLP
jgi:diacylglycerol kinase